MGSNDTTVFPTSDVDKVGWTDQVGGTTNLYDTVNDSASISAASWSAGVASFTTSSAHGLIVGQVITVFRVNPTGYNFTNVAVATVPTTTTFTVPMASNPGSYVSGGIEFTIDPDDYVTTTFLGPSTGEVPRIFIINMDDMRFDDINTKMTDGPRDGEYCLQQTRDRILFTDKTLFVPYFWDDYGLCGPARMEILTGNYYRNHNIKNDESAYYTHARFGAKNATPIWGTELFMVGPWEFDLARQNSIPHTPVSTAAQAAIIAAAHPSTSDPAHTGYIGLAGTGLRKHTIGSSAYAFNPGLVAPPSDTTGNADDLQAYTGNIVNWLSEFGITCCFVGKYHNGYSSSATGFSGEGLNFTFPAGSTNGTRFVPPGWSHWYAVTGDEGAFAGDVQDHFHTRMNLFDGSNPGDGNGAYGSERYYNYSWHINAATQGSGKITFSLDKPNLNDSPDYVTWATAAANNTQTTPAIGYATVDPSTGAYAWVDDLQVGDEVDVDGVTGVAAYNAIGWIVTDVYNGGGNGLSRGQFKVAHSGSLSPGSVTATSRCFIRKYFSDVMFGFQVVQQLAQLGDDEPWFMYWCPRMPHGDVEGGVVEHEFRYDFTVQNDNGGNTQFCHWAGGPGCQYFISDVNGITTATISGTLREFTIQLADPIDVTGTPVDPLMAGDLIAIQDTNTNYDGYYHVVAVINSSKFTVRKTMSSLPPTFNGNPYHATGSSVQIRKYMSPAMDAATLNSVPVGSIAEGAPLDPGKDFPVARSHRRTLYGERHEMLPSTDDGIGTALDYIFGTRGWANTIVIFTSDNGYADGEHVASESNDAWSGVGGKGWVWESSTRLPLYIYNSTMLGSGTTTIRTTMSDIPATLLDLYSGFIPQLAQHHAHFKRDGYSLKRLMENPSDPVHQRAIFQTGKYFGQANCCAIVTHAMEKFIMTPQQVGGTLIGSSHNNPRALYDLSDTIFGTPEFFASDWETVSLLGVNPTRDAQLEAYLSTGMEQRWSIPLNRNTCRDPVI